MSKTRVNLGGKDVVLDMNRPGVADAVANLVKLASERQWAIGMYFDHLEEDGDLAEYQLIRIKQNDGTFRAYLINTVTGRARNSRKVVTVQGIVDPKVDAGYVTDLPAEKDRFIDPDDENGEILID